MVPVLGNPTCRCGYRLREARGRGKGIRVTAMYMVAKRCRRHRGNALLHPTRIRHCRRTAARRITGAITAQFPGAPPRLFQRRAPLPASSAGAQRSSEAPSLS